MNEKSGAIDAAIVFEGVGVTLGNERIYDSVDFAVDRGEFVCLLGPSGTTSTRRWCWPIASFSCPISRPASWR